ncbi:exopolysaccharide biosynthesis protein [Candidatus Methylocalor cossyra]|uniref:Exopolysaccharide biosynthesis protein exod n=1 Tax=Candidatus Methylocalor cossyra TaxID=3108543 RepID=A0ABM9NLB7_9GAMM
MSGYRSLIAALRRLRKRSRVERLTIGSVLDSLGDTAFCLIAVFLALPFLQPFIPLGPFSTAGAVAFIVLGSQLLRGHPEPALPERIRRIPVAPRVIDLIATYSIRFLGWWRRHTRLRHLSWVSGRKGRRVTGGILVAAGCIMIVPFFGIPLNDFFPALAVVSVSVGELERDGLMVLVALVWLAIGAAYCAFLLTLLALFGRGVWDFF